MATDGFQGKTIESWEFDVKIVYDRKFSGKNICLPRLIARFILKISEFRNKYKIRSKFDSGPNLNETI